VSLIFLCLFTQFTVDSVTIFGLLYVCFLFVCLFVLVRLPGNDLLSP